VGVISDTHSLLPTRALELFQDVDHLIHAGDIGCAEVLLRLARVAPLSAVLGNCDESDAFSLAALRQAQNIACRQANSGGGAAACLSVTLSPLYAYLKPGGLRILLTHKPSSLRKALRDERLLASELNKTKTWFGTCANGDQMAERLSDQRAVRQPLEPHAQPPAHQSTCSVDTVSAGMASGISANASSEPAPLTFDVAIHGHTHIPALSQDDGLLTICPGSSSYPRNNDPATVGILSIADGAFAHFELLEVKG
jgi:predicted phosphodiesterase